MRVSVTEIQDFLRCRRSWDFQSANRQSLVAVGVPATALFLGTLVHHGLAEQAMGRDPIQGILTKAAEEEEELRTTYVQRVGADMSAAELERMNESIQHAVQLMRGYVDHYGFETPLGKHFEYILPEVTFNIPIDLGICNHNHAGLDPGECPYCHGTGSVVVEFVGTFDGLARHKLTNALWGVEHKTYSQRANEDQLQLDWQMTGYAWAAYQLFGIPLAGFLYDGINKKLPGVPALLQNGATSKAWIDTTEAVYRSTLLARNQNPEDYEDILARLRERDQVGQSPFFTRYQIPVGANAIIDFENNLRAILTDMANPRLQPYANFRWEGCWDCNVPDLCRATHFGDDLEYIIATRYKRGTYGTQKAVKALSPHWVSSVDDLLEHARNIRGEVTT